MSIKMMLAGATVLALLSAPVVAQPATAMSGSMTAAETGVSPLVGTSATDYVKLAADSDLFEITSSKLALSKSKRDDVKGFAKQMIQDHTTTTKSLMAALNNGERKIAPPVMRLSDVNAAKVALLKKAPKAGFDQLYMQQQLEAHQNAWALHKGYAVDGTDPALKQVAATAVPIIEQHFSHVKAMSGTSM